MVFSLFSRKDKADPRKTPQPEPKSGTSVGKGVGSNAATPSNNASTAPVRTPIRSTESVNPVRAAAMQTMAKIDAIESEMNMSDPTYAQVQSVAVTLSPIVRTNEVKNGTQTQPQATNTMDFATSAILGDTAGAGNMEILGSGFSPVLEEAAILFSNDQANEAASLLLGAIEENNLGPATTTVWMMLFDVYHALGLKNEFESLSIDFASRFESSPPTWRGKKAEVEVKQSPNAVVIAVPETIDQAVVKTIEQVQAATSKGRTVVLEFSKSKTIDPFGAEVLLKTLNAFKKAKREITLTPVDRLVQLCRQSVQPGRRDSSDALWLLFLESLRLQGKQQEFEDASIDYCVTFEVSPPSWEPMPANIRAENNGPISVSDSEKQGTRAEGNIFHLVGDLRGSLATEMALLADFGSSRREIKIDCAHLRRIEFVAAGQLQNHLTTMRALGKKIELFNTSIPVATLFGVVGMNEVAQIALASH